MEIYAGLYDLVAANCRAAGGEFEYFKETFLRDAKSLPQEIDISGYTDLDNATFYQAVFVTTFKRLPEEREWGHMSAFFGMSREEFQEKALREICGSGVAAINRIRFVNNPYFRQRRGIRYHMYGMLYGLTDKSFLREFGKKMPQPIQKIIRKIFL